MRGFIGLAIAKDDDECLQVQLERLAKHDGNDGKHDGNDGTMTASMTAKNIENQHDDGNDGKNEVSHILFDDGSFNTYNIYKNDRASAGNASLPSLLSKNNTLCRHSPVIQPSSSRHSPVMNNGSFNGGLTQPIDNAELDELLQKIPTDDRFAVRQEFEKRHKLDNEGAWAWLVDLIAEKAEK